MPDWVIGFVIVFAITLSCGAYDSFQSAMVSTASNDLFHNKIHLNYIRVIVLLIGAPTIVLALKQINIFLLFLIADLVSCAVMPQLFLGLWHKADFIEGVDVGSYSRVNCRSLLDPLVVI